VDLSKVKTLRDVRALYDRGEYDAAQKAYQRFASRDGPQVAAAIGLAEVLAMRGEYAEALAALGKVEKAGGADAAWHVSRANLLAVLGRYDESLAAARRALAIREDYAAAILAAGRALETTGRKAAAIETYHTVEKTLEDGAFANSAPALVAVGQILDRLAVLAGEKASEQAQNILQNYLQRSYLDVDEHHWPGRVAAGMFLLSKHKPKGATAEFAEAAKGNPKLPDVAAGMAEVYLRGWQFERVEKALAAGLKVNPHHPELHVTRARLLLQWRKFDQVAAPLEKVLAVNPNHLEALSLMAALHIRMRAPAKAEPFITRIEAIHHGPCPGMHLAIGDWLAAGRQFREAEKHLQKAAELAPELAAPWAELGLLHMRRGEEEEALAVLEKAHGIDNFRADVTNYINLLKYMDRHFAVRETAHFIVKVHKTDDAVLLDQVADYMESIHEELCEAYDYRPDEKTVVEIFPTHKGFSLRITGKGWIGTVGASTGRVIALSAPHPKRSPQFGRFNWATVLRHEYVHTLTLAATENRIPHWFTEALAVYEQPDRRNFETVKSLTAALKGGKLFDVEAMDWGFIRPKRRADRSLAYAQAEWTAEYIIAEHGREAIGKMLAGFRDGRTQAEVFSTVLGMSEEAFNKAFRVWAAGQVTAWGFDPSPRPDLAKAQAAAKAKPKDADAQAALADALRLHRRLAQAEATARAALKLDGENPLALKVMTLLSGRAGQEDEALKWAERLDAADPASKVAPRVLAKVNLTRRRYAPALTALEKLKARVPLDAWSYQQLAKVYLQLGQAERALPNLIELNRYDMRDPRWPKQIAEICRDLGRDNEAVRYYEQVLWLNPYDTTVHQTLASVHLRGRRYGLAVRSARLATQASPEAGDAWTTLGRALYYAGRAGEDRALLLEGRKAIEKAMTINPIGPAGRIKVNIEKALIELGAG